VSLKEDARTTIQTGLLYLRGQRPESWWVKRGARIGARCNLLRPFDLDPDHCWLVEIGDDVTLAPEVRVIAHDASSYDTVRHTRIARVRIGSRVFVGARSTILPGVTIGDDVIIGAGSVVARDIPAGTVAMGNPARVHCSIEDYRSRLRQRFDGGAPRFDEAWTARSGITAPMKAEMNSQLANEDGFVV
jgi:maltose O-acetyltransferase